MKSIQKVLWLFALCTNMLFFSKNASAQCSSFNVTASKTADGGSKGDVTVTASVTGGSGSYVRYYWYTSSYSYLDWGAVKTNFNAGTYCVIARDSFSTGICLDTFCLTITDTGTFNCANMVSSISEADSCALGDVNLFSWVSGGSGSYSFSWNTGDTSQHLYNRTNGTFSVIITDVNYGCKDTVYKTVVDDTCNVCDSFKNKGYIEERDGCYYNDVTLVAQNWGGSQSYAYKWDNGDTLSTVYSRSTGSYSVIVIDRNYGCTDTLYRTVIDDTCNPCRDFGAYLYKQDSCQSNDLKIYAYAYGGSGNYSYVWNTGSTASFLTNRGTGWYKVTITDVVRGCTRIDSIYVIDSNFKCCLAWFYTSDSAVASTKTFYGNSNVNDSIGGGSTTYTWSFGDGNTGTGQTKSHTYMSSGSKTVCLYINTASGCKDTFCRVVSAPAPGKNLKVSHYGMQYVRDINRYIYITFQNIGTTTENGTVEYKYPVGMTFVSSNISSSTHIGNKITFSLGSLAPGASGTIYVVMRTPMSFTIGSIKCDTAIILPVSGDMVPANNTSYECDEVVGSWDPNDKTPNPKGIGPDGNIPPTTSEIGYLIRFENEGNWRTYRVRVEDEIDPSFDINSLMIGDVSHAYRLVRKDNKLNWYFDDIELTPKSVNPDKSHGYIQYTLQLKPGLSLGTQLKNTAYIYFDANPAIITNTTKNTLKNTDGSSAVKNLASDDLLDFDLKRNGDKLTIFSPSKMQALRIFDISGKLLLENELNSDKEEIENVQLSQGIYIIHVDIDNQTVIKKFKF